MAGDQYNHQPKHNPFGNAKTHVRQVCVLFQLVRIKSLRHLVERHHDQLRSPHPEEDRLRDQDGHGKQHGDHPRADQKIHRMHPQRPERIHLLGDLHGADLRRHSRAHPAGHHKPCQHRSQLPAHRQGHNTPYHGFESQLIEFVINLSREYRPRKRSRNDYLQLGTKSHTHQLVKHQPPTHWMPENGTQHLT